MRMFDTFFKAIIPRCCAVEQYIGILDCPIFFNQFASSIFLANLFKKNKKIFKIFKMIFRTCTCFISKNMRSS